MLEELLGSKVRARMIAALLVAPGQRLHLRALVRSAGGSVAAVQREIDRLEHIGLATSAVDDHGKRQISLMDDHPFTPALAGLLAADPRAQYRARSVGVPNLNAAIDDVLGGAIDAIVTGFDPVRIVLFGSRARGTASEDSDIDLLVVMPEVEDDRATSALVRGAIGPVGYGVDVMATDAARIERAMTRADSVLRDAIEEGVTIYDGAGR